jgi:AcrR family transcriptional regulator
LNIIVQNKQYLFYNGSASPDENKDLSMKAAPKTARWTEAARNASNAGQSRSKSAQAEINPPMTGMSAAQRRIHQAALRLFAEKGSAEVSVSELAEAAGVARGTIYNNLDSTDHLFERVASQLSKEMNLRVADSYTGIDDAALRMATGIRLYVRRAHEESHWGRFMTHFSFRPESLAAFTEGPLLRDLVLGLEQRRFTFAAAQLHGAIGLVAGTTLSAILLVLEGLRTWRDAGTDAAELALRGLGIEAEEARALAKAELPPLHD